MKSKIESRREGHSHSN